MKNMKKIQILIIAFLISASIFALTSMQTKALLQPTVSAPTLNPSVSTALGTSVSLSVTVSGQMSIPFGTVTFQMEIGGGAYSNISSAVNLNSDAYATTTYTPLVAGNYQFDVIYNGDSIYEENTSDPTPLTVNQATATVGAATFSPISPIALGASVMVSATVTGPAEVTAPTGDVQFQVSINSSSYAAFGSPVVLSGSLASTSYTPSTATTYTFKAVYEGDSNYLSAISGGASGTLAVNEATATIGAATFTPASPIILGASVMVSATVTGSGGITAPTGDVQFQVSINGSSYANFGTAIPLSGNSVSVQYTPLIPTTYSFEAVYQGDSNYVPGTGLASGTLTVNKATATVPVPTLSPSGSTTVETSVSLSVTVSGSGATPTGNVTFQVEIGSGGFSNIGSAVSLSSGSASATYTPLTTGSYQFDVVYTGDTNYNGASGSPASLTVNPGSATHFVVSGFPSSTVAGVAHSFTVTAKDAYNNTVTSYAGTVKITSSDSKAVLPANAGLVSGVGSFTVTLKTAGSQSITATDTVTSSITGSQSGILVSAASGDYFVVSGFPSPTVAGVAHTVKVTVYDMSGNVATGYAGTVAITTSDSKAVLPLNSVLSDGTGSFSVVLETVGSQSITATDTVTSSITGLQNDITVNVAGVASFVVSGFPQFYCGWCCSQFYGDC